MMTFLDERKRIKKLPQAIQDFLGSDEIVEVVQELTKIFHLNDEYEARFVEFIRKIFLRDIPFHLAEKILRQDVLPKEIDAKVFFQTLRDRHLFKFDDYFREETQQTSQSVKKSDEVIKPSVGDVKRLTGVDVSVTPQAQIPDRKVLPVKHVRLEGWKMKDGKPVRALEAKPSTTPVAMNPDLQRRYDQLVLAFLKDVRDANETRNYFTRSSKIGGLDLSEAEADRRIALLKEQKKQVLEGEASAQKPQSTPPLPLPQQHEPRPIEKQTSPPAQLPTPPTQSPPPPELIVSSLKKVPVKETLPPPPPPAPSSEPSYAAPPAVPNPVAVPKPIPRIRRNFPVSDRPALIDIKHPKEVMGPTEEMRHLTLGSFRELASSAAASANKIYEKIMLLGEESVAKQAQGIAAWKSSEPHHIYLTMGKTSMSKGWTLKETIEQRAHANLSSLTEEEFFAIADLNQRLRF